MRTKEIQAMIKEGVFNSGVVIDRASVQKLTKRARPTATFNRKTIQTQLKSHLLLVEFQHKVNKQLHQKGLHLKAQNYDSEFRVLSRKETAATVDYYWTKAHGAETTAQILEVGRAKRK